MRGQIRKRGKSWTVIVYVGRDAETGKERRKWYAHKTRREAEAHLAQLVTHLHGGGTLPNTKILLGDYLDSWLRDHAEIKNLAAATRRNYRDTLRVHLQPALGHLPLARLSPQDVSRCLGDTLRKGLSPTSAQYHFGLLHEALSHAVRKGLIGRNPCDMVDRPRRAEVESRVLDEEQTRIFLAEARRVVPHLYRLFLSAVLTGMRQGELLGLRWQDVDFTLGVANLQQTFYRLGKQQVWKQPKTTTGRRTVALPPVLVEELRAGRDEQAALRREFGSGYHDHGLVFCQVDGKPLHGRNITKRVLRRVLNLQGLRKALRKQGVAEENLPKPLPAVTFHGLRHSHATHLLRQGVNAKIVAERLGHSTPAFTLARYSHVLPGMQEEAARLVATRLLAGMESSR
jgi:integrase